MSDRDRARRAWCAAAVVVVVVAGACKKSRAGGPGGVGGGGPMGLPVEVAVARIDTVRDEITATGEIEAVQSIDLRPEVDGRIVDILVREGQEVEKEAPLFKVDDAQLRAQVAQLEAQRDLAQQALARTKDLANQNASSAADLERAEATARSAQAEYDLQRIRLERTTVRAPFTGVVGQRYVSLGDYVTTSTRLVSLHTVNPQRASFPVPERFARLLRPGQKVTFRVAAIPGRDFTGQVDFVDPVIQLPGRTIMVKARAPNGQRLLQPGMFIEARLVTAVRPGAIVIPAVGKAWEMTDPGSLLNARQQGTTAALRRMLGDVDPSAAVKILRPVMESVPFAGRKWNQPTNCPVDFSTTAQKP